MYNNTLYLSPQRGGLLSTLDKEGLSVLDITMKDRPSHVVFKTAGKESYWPEILENLHTQ